MAKELKKEFKNPELKKLEKENNVLRKKLAEAEEVALLANAKYEILEKSMPSCTSQQILIMLMKDKKANLGITKTKFINILFFQPFMNSLLNFKLAF
ncbi:hypothetical protein [Williamsoniiplasma lucivorax]|uniref:hypothetical protein n=1 Tax=Williamsoniiplasma lucivorax TaxID=209274 RepID=UPI0011B0962A|nr:hypothetical protein [Williamsoniiplasma lucivorax]